MKDGERDAISYGSGRLRLGLYAAILALTLVIPIVELKTGIPLRRDLPGGGDGGYHDPLSWGEVWTRLPEAFLPYLVIGALGAALVEWSIWRKRRGAAAPLLDWEDEIEDDSPSKPYTRLWVRATIGYFAAAALAFCAYLEGAWDWGLPPLFALAVFAPIPVSLGLLAIYADEFQLRGRTFYRHKTPVAYWVCVASIVAAGAAMFLAGVAHGAADDYDVVLRSSSPEEQRAALAAILRDPQRHLPRIQQSLRAYPQLLRAEANAANRAVYLAALVRDPSFAPILAGILGHEAVLDACLYSCPVVFALAIHASFAGWAPPRDLDPKLDTVSGLQSAIRYVRGISLETQPIGVQGPAFERHRRQIEGKTEERLIEMAGATGGELRLFAAYALQSSIATSRNRIALYSLLMNEGRPDASHEYRSAIYDAIYRAETAISSSI